MATLGDLVVNLTANATKFTSGLASAGNSLASFAGRAILSLGRVTAQISGLTGRGPSIISFAGRMARGLGSIGLAAMGLMAVWHGLQAMSAPLQIAAGAEQNQVAFATMIGSAEQAKKTLGELSGFAAATPFGSEEIVGAGRKLLAFNVQAQDLIPTLTALGDISAGIGAPIGEIAELYGKAKVQGRLFMEDINQLTGRGIPIIQELAKQFKKPESAIREMVEKGQVNFSHLQTAFSSLTAEGGKFGGLMAAQSQTTAGLWSSLQDNLSIALGQIGAAFIEAFNLKGGMTGLNDFLAEFTSTWLPTITSTFNATAAFLTETWTAFVTHGQFIFWEWVDSISMAFKAVVEVGTAAFAALTAFITSSLGGGWGEVSALLAFAVRHWDSLLLIALENVKLFATNAIAHVQAFFTNMGKWFAWLPDNWFKVLKTMASLLQTVFLNMAKNVGSFFKSLWDFAKGKGFKLETTDMMDGFENSIDQLPQLVGAAVQNSTPELNRLYDELGTREAEFQREQAKRIEAAKPKATFEGLVEKKSLPQKTLADILDKKKPPDPKKAGAGKQKQDLKAVEANSADAFRMIVEGTGRGPKSEQQKLVSNTAEMKKLLHDVITEQQKTTTATKGIKQPKPVSMFA